jgi:membrane fusion protein (multidrug efflux system)
MHAKMRIPISIIVLIPLFLLVSCNKSGTENNEKKIPPVNIHIQTVKPEQLVDAIQVAGIVKAIEDANVSPEEGGVVKEWRAKKGQSVQKGDLIIVLKDEVARASYDAAEAQYKMAEMNLEKQKEVYAQQGISELQYRTFEYTRDAAKAQAELMKARWERTQIRSPFDGIVDNIIPNEGEFAPTGVPIARVVNTSTLKIQAEVQEIYSGAVTIGTNTTITIDAVPGVTLKGRVTFISSTVSSANRTLLAEVLVPNTNRRIKPDMIAKVKFLRETKSNAILVSENIIQLVDRDRTILYVEKDGKAEERVLKLGGRQGNMVEIVEGLKAGDHLITSGYQKLVNGTPVIIVQEAENSK